MLRHFIFFIVFTLSLQFAFGSVEDAKFNSYWEWNRTDGRKDSDTLLKKGEQLYNLGYLDSSLLYFTEIQRRYTSQMASSEKLVCAKASNYMGMIFFRAYNYVGAIQKYLWAMDVAKEEKNIQYERKIENNIAGIYYITGEYTKAHTIFKRFFEYNLAEAKADSNILFMSYGNLVMCAMHLPDKKILKQALEMGEEKLIFFNSLACYPYYIGYADYYRSLGKADFAIVSAKKSISYIPHLSNENSFIAESHRQIALGYIMKNEINMALHHLDTSIFYGEQGRVLDILIQDYELKSEIFKQQGSESKQIASMEKYLSLKDSLLSFHKYGQLKELEYYATISKLQKKQEEKEATIQRQKNTMMIGGSFIFLLSILLSIVLKQKRKLSQGYQLLYEKQKELLRLAQGKVLMPPSQLNNRDKEINPEITKRKKQLTEEITGLIENTDLFYQQDFNLDVLAKTLNSNTHYVSEVINENFKKNFANLVNEVRIKKACMYLDEDDYQKYTLEFLAQKVGFKGRTTFNPAFKKHTGITPSQYIKLTQQSTEKQDSKL